RRHRRGLLRASGLALIVALAIWGFSSYRQAQLLAQREEARGQLAEFEQLTEEAEYFAANTDVIGERAPHYHPQRAATLGNSALSIAATWGPQAAKLSLDDNRAKVAQEEYELLLRMALVALGQNQSPEAAREALALVDRAKDMGQPSHEYYLLRGQGL